MYRVYADSTLICDSRDDELAIINPVVTLEANKAGTFVFTLPATHPFYSTIERRQTIVKVYKDKSTTPLFEGLATGVMIDFWKQKQITCEGIMTVFNDTLQRQARYEVDSTTAVRDLLKSFIDIHNSQNDIKFEVGSVTVTDSNGYIACFTNYESTMDCLSADLVEDYGGYLRLRYDGDTRYIDYLLDSPRTCTQAVRLGENLVDFDIEYDTNELCTVLVPLGATLEDRTSSAIEGLDEKLTIQSVNNGKDYIESASAIESFGRITKTVEWSEVTVASNLLRKGKEYLESAQFETMTITANAIDLYALGEADQSFELLDKIRVVSKPHGMDKYFILTQMTLNLNNPENDTITLGGSGSVGISAKANSASESILKEIEKIQPSSILQSARDNATSLITSSTEGYVTLIKTDDGKNVKELVITDTPNYKDATKCWRWNSGGFGYSANGYDGDYNLAMTMDGSIVADFINTGKMSVDRLTGKIGAGADVSIVWDAIADGTSKATQITKDTVTTSYINALNVTAGSVAAENITGTKISGKTIESCDITGCGITTASGKLKVTDIEAINQNGVSFNDTHIIVWNGITSYNTISVFSSGGIYSSGNIYTAGSLGCGGTKPRVVKTKNYGLRQMYAYETASPYFGDIGEGVIDDEGICYVNIEEIFGETIELSTTYQVFLQKYGEGDCYVSERNGAYFVVKGTPNMRFGWEVKAIQRDYAGIRNEIYTMPNVKKPTEEEESDE